MTEISLLSNLFSNSRLLEFLLMYITLTTSTDLTMESCWSSKFEKSAWKSYEHQHSIKFCEFLTDNSDHFLLLSVQKYFNFGQKMFTTDRFMPKMYLMAFYSRMTFLIGIGPKWARTVLLYKQIDLLFWSISYQLLLQLTATV